MSFDPCLKKLMARGLALMGLAAVLFPVPAAEAGAEVPSGEVETATQAAEAPESVPMPLWAEQQLLVSYQKLFDAARQQRLSGVLDLAEKGLIRLLEGQAPEEVKRPALLELAFLKHEQKEWQKAQLLYAEFTRRYPNDPSVPEILFRQGTVYRELGIPSLALTKFYAVISSCLNLQLGQMDYYKKLVLRAQQEIAETHYLKGDMAEAADFFGRLLKLDSPDLNRSEIMYKLARAQAGSGAYEELVATGQIYLEKYPEGPDAPEMRYFLADGLKKLGRNKEALQAILVLLQAQQAQSKENPEHWRYWQQKAGNEIANQLYREGDYLNALQIYQTLAALNDAPEWQLPVWYQIGLVYENLKQHPKAAEMYEKVAVRAKDLGEPSPAMKAIVDMAAFRKEALAWEETARLANQRVQEDGQLRATN